MTVVVVRPGDESQVSVRPITPAPVEAGRAGPASKGWIFDEGPPNDMQGRIGEMYLDTLTYDAYGPKPGLSWAGVDPVNLKAGAAEANEARDQAVEAAELAEESAEAAHEDRLHVAETIGDAVDAALAVVNSKFTVSTSAPSPGVGTEGDIWLKI
jgi:hypothetical protein